MYIVGQAINGISLNGLEWLMDNEDEEMEFNSIEEAINFLKDNGYDDWEDEEIRDTFTFKKVKHA